ncbi:unnamed protein product [Prunus armeniaca]
MDCYTVAAAAGIRINSFVYICITPGLKEDRLLLSHWILCFYGSWSFVECPGLSWSVTCSSFCYCSAGLEYFLFVDPHQEVSIYTRWQRCKSDLNMKQLMELYAELEKLEKLYSFCQNLNC